MAITHLPSRSHFEVLKEHVSLNGATILDIGSGEGRFTRLMAGAGAKVTGIEPGLQQIRRALTEKNVAGERYLQGGAEALDAADNSVDAVTFFNSLHHVPLNLMNRAMDEACRVLRPGGLLYIAEPLAEGPQYELSKPVNDEAAIRDRAYESIRGITGTRMIGVTEIRYVADGKYPSYEAWRDNSVAIDPERAPRFAIHESALRLAFSTLGERRDDGWHFPQPVRVNVLRKPS